MEALPARCPKCGDEMSTPMLGRHSRRMVSTCRNGACRHTIHSSEPVTRSEDLPRRPGSSDHGAMFVPNTARPEPPRPRPGAMDQFERAAMSGTLREAIKKNRAAQRSADAVDPRLKQLGRDR